MDSSATHNQKTASDVIEPDEIRRIEEAVRRAEAQQRSSERPEAVVLVFAW